MTFEYVCTRNDLADLLEIPHGKLTHVLYVAKVDSFYKIFEIPKKSGKKDKGGLKKYAEGIETLSEYLELDSWDENSIKNRADDLATKALNVWKI